MAQGRNTITQRIALEGGSDIEKGLGDLGKTGEEAFRRIGDSVSNLDFSNLSNLSTLFGTLKSALGSVGGVIGTAATAIAGLAAGYATLASKASDAVSEIQEGATRVGTSTENYTGLKFAFQQSGAGAEAFEKAMSIVGEASAQAAEAAQKATETIIDNTKQLKEHSDNLSKIYQDQGKSIRDGGISTQRSIEDANTAAERSLSESGANRTTIQRQLNQKLEDIALSHKRKLQDIARETNDKIEEEYKRSSEAIKKFNDDVAQKAQEAADKAGNAFTKLGIKLLEGTDKVRDPTEIYRDVADAISKIPDPATQAAKAIEIFGRRAGPQLIENLKEGRAGIDAFIKESKELGLQFTPEQIKAGKQYQDTMSKLGEVLSATASKMGLEFVPGLNALVDAIATARGRAQGEAVGWAKSIADAISPILNDITNMVKGVDDKQIVNQWLISIRDNVIIVGKAFAIAAMAVGSALSQIYDGLQFFAELYNTAFSTNLNGTDLLIYSGYLYALAKAFTYVRGAMIAMVAGNPVLLALTAIGIAIGLLLPIVIKNWPEIMKWLTDLGKSFTNLGDSIVGWGKGIDDSVRAAFWGMFDWLMQKFTDAQKWLDDLLAKAKDFFGMGGDYSGGGDYNAGGEVVAAAGGGHVRGRGTHFSDSIPARLSAGEFVMNWNAVRKYGLDFMHAINSLSFPAAPAAVGGMSFPARRSLGFAAGGVVPAAAIGDHVTVDILAGGQPFAMGLLAPRAVAASMVRQARTEETMSAGRKPGWHGKGRVTH